MGPPGAPGLEVSAAGLCVGGGGFVAPTQLRGMGDIWVVLWREAISEGLGPAGEGTR